MIEYGFGTACRDARCSLFKHYCSVFPETKNFLKKITLNPLSFQILFLSLRSVRIAGNAGERPANVANEYGKCLVGRPQWRPFLLIDLHIIGIKVSPYLP